MQKLTNDTTRLKSEIITLREQRQTLLSNLVLQTENRKIATASMRASFAEGQAKTGRMGKHDRLEFLAGLKQTVACQRQGVQLDLAGVRSAWTHTDISRFLNELPIMPPGRQERTEKEERSKRDRSEPSRRKKTGDRDSLQSSYADDPIKAAKTFRKPRKNDGRHSKRVA